MPIEVELGVPLHNPLNQSDYNQCLRNLRMLILLPDRTLKKL